MTRQLGAFVIGAGQAGLAASDDAAHIAETIAAEAWGAR